MDWNAVQLPDALQERLQAAKQQSATSAISFYEGFGSFHSENVEDLMGQSDAEYKPPSCLPQFAKQLLGNTQLHHLAHLPREQLQARAAAKRPREEPTTTTTTTSTPLFALGDSDVSTAQTSGAPVSEPSTDVEAAGTHSPSRESSVDRANDTEAFFAAPLKPGPSAIRRTTPTHDCRPLSDASVCMPTGVHTKPTSFGDAFRHEYFSIDPDMTFINHGAFGSALTGGVHIKRCYEAHMEEEVVQFVDRELLPLVVHSIRALAKFMHADPKQVVLLQNATFALNAAMRLIGADDIVAFLDTEYLAVYKMMWFRCQEVGASLHEIRVSKYLHDDAVMGDDEQLTRLIVSQLPKGCTTFVVDYVTSTSALCLPIFTHLVPALRQHGVTKIIVDAAHAPLQIDLNFAALAPQNQPTVCVGNLHKWFSSPKSAGFMWVNTNVVEDVHSVVLSHGAGDGLLSEFIWDGTRDYGAYLAIPAIVDFWTAQGCDRVRNHCSDMLESVADMLTTAFRSRKVARRAPFMSLIELPEELQDEFVTAKYIQDVLHDTFKIEVPVKRVEGRYYLRVSVFVYNTPTEYAYLRDAVLLIASKWKHSDALRELKEETQRTQSASATGASSPPEAAPCDERIRRQGGCGVSALDPSAKRKRTAKFA